jgi:hypothetical protein
MAAPHQSTAASPEFPPWLRLQATGDLYVCLIPLIVVCFQQTNIPGKIFAQLVPLVPRLILLHRERQRGEPRTSESYVVLSRDRILLPEDSSSAQRGSAYHISNGTTSNRPSGMRSADAVVVPQQTSGVLDSTDFPELSISAQPSHLSSLARNFVDLGLGNYIDSSQFYCRQP